jgi:hypothetical protein
VISQIISKWNILFPMIIRCRAHNTARRVCLEEISKRTNASLGCVLQIKLVGKKRRKNLFSMSASPRVKRMRKWFWRRWSIHQTRPRHKENTCKNIDEKTWLHTITNGEILMNRKMKSFAIATAATILFSTGMCHTDVALASASKTSIERQTQALNQVDVSAYYESVWIANGKFLRFTGNPNSRIDGTLYLIDNPDLPQQPGGKYIAVQFYDKTGKLAYEFRHDVTHIPDTGKERYVHYYEKVKGNYKVKVVAHNLGFDGVLAH